MGDKIAYDRRYYAKHREELLQKKRQKRADAKYREQENKRWSAWYRQNADAWKVGRVLGVKISEARQIIGANHV
jgi:hypothetical protein